MSADANEQDKDAMIARLRGYLELAAIRIGKMEAELADYRAAPAPAPAAETHLIDCARATNAAAACTCGIAAATLSKRCRKCGSEYRVPSCWQCVQENRPPFPIAAPSAEPEPTHAGWHWCSTCKKQTPPDHFHDSERAAPSAEPERQRCHVCNTGRGFDPDCAYCFGTGLEPMTPQRAAPSAEPEEEAAEAFDEAIIAAIMLKFDPAAIQDELRKAAKIRRALQSERAELAETVARLMREQDLAAGLNLATGLNVSKSAPSAGPINAASTPTDLDGPSQEGAAGSDAAPSAEAGGQCTLGVGDGSGRLFVHGDYDSIKAAQAIILERDELRTGIIKLLTRMEGRKP